MPDSEEGMEISSKEARVETMEIIKIFRSL